MSETTIRFCGHKDSGRICWSTPGHEGDHKLSLTLEDLTVSGGLLLTGEFKENAEDLNTGDHVQVDVNPPMTNGQLEGIGRRTAARDDTDHYTFTIDGIGYDGHWANDIARLLAEVESRGRAVEALSARLTAKNSELDHCIRASLAAGVEFAEKIGAMRAERDEAIREAAADKAKLAAVRDAITPKNPDWKPLTERHPEYFKPVSPEEAARKKGWGQGVALLTQQIQHALDAPEMPRPPAEEAQERPETAGTGSGRGTGVTEAPGTAQESDWPNVDGWTLIARPTGILLSHDTDADRPLLLADELPLGAVLAFIEDQQPEEDDKVEPDLSLIPAGLTKSDPGIRGGEPCITGTRIPASEVAGYLADGLSWDEVRAMLPSLPSLPVPSTERTTT